MDFPTVSTVTRWMEGITPAAQTAGDSQVTFAIISPSGLGTIQKSGGWIDVRAHSSMVFIAKANTTGCSIRLEYKRTTSDDVVSIMVPTTALVAGTTTEIYNGPLERDVAYFRVVVTSGTAPNTVDLSFLVR